MAKWARVENGEVIEIISFDPAGKFHPSLTWTPCSDAASPGWTLDNGSFTKPKDPDPSILLKAKQEVMKKKIVAEEDRRSWLPIEHPDHSGVFHKVTEAINNTIDRLQGVGLSEKLPINSGNWDDIDGTPIAFTYGDLISLRNAIYDRGAYNYGVSKYHISEMMKLQDPSSYNYSGGWA
jgi:hypothetical protein